MKKQKNYENGMTLVEIIVSLAILGIMAAIFLPIFTGMFKWIADAGNRDKAVYQARGAVENAMASTTPGADNLIIHINGSATNITLKGRVEAQTVTVGGRTVSVTAYVPNN